MRKMLAFLTPATACLTALLLAGGAPPVSGQSPARPGRAEAAGSPGMPLPGHRADSRPISAAATTVVQPGGPGPHDRPEARAASILRDLSAWTAAGASGPPDVFVREVVALIDEHPETADLFLAALDKSTRQEWAILGGAFFRLADPELRMRTVRAHRAADPFRARLAETLTDERRVVDALRDEAGGEFRRLVLDSALLEGMVLEEVRRIAVSAPEEALRSRAIHRLGAHEDDASLTLVLSILERDAAPEADRMAAAFALSYRTGPRLKQVWVDLLERGASLPILAHAARGLIPYVGEAGVHDVLLREVSRSSAPDVLRREAATALSRGWNRIPDSERAVVLGGIRALVRGLVSDPSSRELHDLLVSEFAPRDSIYPGDSKSGPVFQWAKETR